MLQKVNNTIRSLVNDCFRRRINKRNRLRLRNRDITLIASNCNGCLMLHDLGLRFNSPFVNLFVEADDFIRLLQRFDYYMSKELEFAENTAENYPVAYLEDVKIHFVHYKTEDEAREKWVSRKARMNMDNCYILFTDRDGCTKRHLEQFDRLPFHNKVVFTNAAYADIPSAVFVRGFEQDACVGNLHRYRGWNGLRYYDDFDYVAWFNGTDE